MSDTAAATGNSSSSANAAAVNAGGSGTEQQAASSISKNTDTLGRVDVQGLVNDVKGSSSDVQAQRDLAASAAKQIEDRGTRQEFVKALEDQGVARKPGFFEQQWQGIKGTATGVYEGGASLVTGVVELGKMGVNGTVEAGKFGAKYISDGDFRDKTNAAVDQGLRTAADATGRGLTAAGDYVADRYANPEKLASDRQALGSVIKSGAEAVGRKADQVYDNYDKARSEAVIQGTTDELAGRIVGRAGFEIGTLVVPVTKLGAVGKGASIAADANTAVKVTKGVDTAVDVNRATKAGTITEVADQAIARTGDDAARVGRTEEGLRAQQSGVTSQADDVSKTRSADVESSRGALGPNAGGDGYARQVLPGGNGQAIAGHGELRALAGQATMPEGTTLVLPRNGIKISDQAGRVLETIDLDRLAAAGPKASNRLIREQLDTLGIDNGRVRNRVLSDLKDLQIVGPGQQVPNFTVKTPDGLVIHRNSTTVESSTPLSDLLKPNSGTCGLATCTEYKR